MVRLLESSLSFFSEVLNDLLPTLSQWVGSPSPERVFLPFLSPLSGQGIRDYRRGDSIKCGFFG